MLAEIILLISSAMLAYAVGYRLGARAPRSRIANDAEVIAKGKRERARERADARDEAREVRAWIRDTFRNQDDVGF